MSDNITRSNNWEFWWFWCFWEFMFCYTSKVKESWILVILVFSGTSMLDSSIFCWQKVYQSVLNFRNFSNFRNLHKILLCKTTQQDLSIENFGVSGNFRNFAICHFKGWGKFNFSNFSIFSVGQLNFLLTKGLSVIF